MCGRTSHWTSDGFMALKSEPGLKTGFFSLLLRKMTTEGQIFLSRGGSSCEGVQHTLLVGDVVNQGNKDMYVTFGDSSASSLALNVDNAGSGDIHIMFGDDSASRVTRCAYNYGSGDTYSSTSSADVPCYTNIAGDWPQNVYNQGSGHLYIKYGNCGSSTSRLVQNVYNQGSGDIKISYGNCNAVTYTIHNAGSGHIYINNGSSNAHRMARSTDEEMTYKIHNAGSGHVYIRNGSSNAQMDRSADEEMTYKIHNAGSGHIYINNGSSNAHRMARSTDE